MRNFGPNGRLFIVGDKGFLGHRVMEHLHSKQTIIIDRQQFKKILKNEFKIEFNSDDRILNLAWENLDNFRSPSHLTKILPEHIEFYEAVVKMGLKNIVAIGTCLEYGKKEGELEESQIADPKLPYAIAKDSLRRFLEFIADECHINLTWIRLFYLYGEGQSSRTIFGQLVAAVREGRVDFDMSPGMQKRDYLAANDMAKLIAELTFRDGNYGIVNCCSGEPITMIDFITQRMQELGVNLKLNLGRFSYPSYEAMEFWGSNKKLKRILGEKSE